MIQYKVLWIVIACLMTATALNSLNILLIINRVNALIDAINKAAGNG